ncbi:DNA repair protein RAD51 homolog 2 isoform X1 [Pseudonaja textilis]|uniref:DNA repair protein RAD51 homolog 2 isoform X1 n=1 Tax=Pseudonaja textilis TaxID=8673 RepID=UPI000EA97F99|nr:DNA repair protein RAD51 homolog 2 isoform X1 [Pseudonaja textilis]XP_026564454.1 DNA repair protein RAD51 homolog 2 isoform X1 [Pseudonaja textilis]
MANKKLRRAGLPQDLCERLSRHQIITCRDFLCLSFLELMKMTGQSYWSVQKLFRTVSLSCAPRMQTAYEMKMKRALNPSAAFLPTTLEDLDKILHGGIACSSLTELSCLQRQPQIEGTTIVQSSGDQVWVLLLLIGLKVVIQPEITGPSGCGKTQFCIMMSLLATMPTNTGGLDGAVIYIDTESAFTAERLVEIAQHRFPNYFATEEKLIAMTNKVLVYQELTCDSVLKRIKSLEEEIISKNVKLIIVDSVASVVRKEFDTKRQGNLKERSNLLTKEASILKYLAEEFSIPVILTNQITTWLSDGLAVQADLLSPVDDLSLSEGSSRNGDWDSGYVTAALGNTWSHCVNTRLILQYLDSKTRQILVAKTPIAPLTSFLYIIENSGLVLQETDPKEQPCSNWEGINPALQAIKVRKDTFHNEAEMALSSFTL